MFFLCVFFYSYFYFIFLDNVFNLFLHNNLFYCHLQGNLDFILEEDQAIVEDKVVLATVATLLNSTVEEVEKALCYRVVAARGEVMEKGHTLEDAYYGRDALCKVTLSLNAFFT